MVSMINNNTPKTRIEIDLNAVRQNLLSIKERVGSDKTILLAVKADGYGHGAVRISRMVEEEGLCHILGVSSPQEGIELRESGVKLPILNLGVILPRREIINALLDFDLTQTVADMDLAVEISRAASERKKSASVHLKIDTGMGRIGCTESAAPGLAGKICALKSVRLEGIFSHLPVSDELNSDFTESQVRKFKSVIVQLDRAGIDVKYRHLANSAGILNYNDSLFNTVRPGLIAYGYRPSPGCNGSIKLIPSMSFKSFIVFVKRVKRGTPLSYGLTYRTSSDSTIATVPVGYGDGYSRFLSNKGKVIIGGRIYPVAGRVCMDQLLVDLGDDEYLPGEEVILFGKDNISAETLAEWIGTIPYEITCSISKRVQRVYLPVI